MKALNVKRRVILAGLCLNLLLAFSSTGGADDEALPVPYVTAAPNGHFYFKMIPDSPLDREKGRGICYQVLGERNDQIFWETSGWYSSRVYLTHDGKSLVRFGNWPRGHELSDDHVAIAFYFAGKLIKSYSTKDLVKDPQKIQTSMSHYYWHKGSPEIEVYRYQFTLTTIDNIEYVFDIKTGNIILATQL